MAQGMAERKAKRAFTHPTNWQLEAMYDGAVSNPLNMFEVNHPIQPFVPNAFRRYLIITIVHGAMTPFSAGVLEYPRCRRCHQVLSHPRSIPESRRARCDYPSLPSRGTGPECSNRCRPWPGESSAATGLLLSRKRRVSCANPAKPQRTSHPRFAWHRKCNGCKQAEGQKLFERYPDESCAISSIVTAAFLPANKNALSGVRAHVPLFIYAAIFYFSKLLRIGPGNPQQ